MVKFTLKYKYFLNLEYYINGKPHNIKHQPILFKGV